MGLKRQKPFFSIITPSLNKGEYIEGAIRSVISQNYSDYEYIIIDGESSDSTLRIIKKYKHIKCVVDKKLSFIDAMNTGINLSSGEIISILNADDFYEPNAFSTASQVFLENPNVDMVVGNLNICDKKGKVMHLSKPKITFFEMLLSWKNEWPYNPSAYFYKKSVHDSIGLYDPKSWVSNDYDFLLRAARNYKLYYINKTLGNFRIYEGTLTSNNQEKNLINQIELAKYYSKDFLSITYYKFLYSYLRYRIPKIKNIVIHRLRRNIALRSRIKFLLEKLT